MPHLGNRRNCDIQIFSPEAKRKSLADQKCNKQIMSPEIEEYVWKSFYVFQEQRAI